MEYLADTVTIIRHFSGAGSIGKRVISILDDTERGKNYLYISVISIVEIMYLSEKRRIKINLAETLNIINNSANYSIVDLTPDIVMIAKNIEFSELHDRLIMATAKFLEIPILTSDKEICKIDGIKTI